MAFEPSYDAPGSYSLPTVESEWDMPDRYSVSLKSDTDGIPLGTAETVDEGVARVREAVFGSHREGLSHYLGGRFLMESDGNNGVIVDFGDPLYKGYVTRAG